jgi:hypothetical protein
LLRIRQKIGIFHRPKNDAMELIPHGATFWFLLPFLRASRKSVVLTGGIWPYGIIPLEQIIEEKSLKILLVFL